MIRQVVQEPASIAFAITATIVVAYLVDANVENMILAGIILVPVVALIELYEWWTGNEVFPYSRRST